MSESVDTDSLRAWAVDAREVAAGGGSGPNLLALCADNLVTAANEVDRLRAVDEFGMNRIVKAVADEWFDWHAPSNVSMDDLNLLVHMITKKLGGDKA